MMTRNVFSCRKCGKILRATNLIKSEEFAQKLETLKIKCPLCGNTMELEIQKFNPPYWNISSFRSDTQTPLWLTFLNSEIVSLWPDHIQLDIHKLLESGYGGDLEIIAKETCYRITLDPLNFSFTEGRKKVKLMEQYPHLRPRIQIEPRPPRVNPYPDTNTINISSDAAPSFVFTGVADALVGHPTPSPLTEGLTRQRRRTQSEH